MVVEGMKYIIVNPSTPKMGGLTALIGYAFLSPMEGPMR